MIPALEDLNRNLEGKHPLEILEWASERFEEQLVLTSSFQTQSIPLLHMISQVAPATPILFLETGYHFPETLSFKHELTERWGLTVVDLHGDKQAEYEAQDGREPLFKQNPDRCCFINKVEPLDEALSEYTAWLSGVRRDQAPARQDLRILEPARAVEYRIHPLADWTQAEIEAYRAEHNLPEHPLTARGYTSIGCEPCTARPTGSDPRSGRWAGQGKLECGIHTELRGPGAGPEPGLEPKDDQRRDPSTTSGTPEPQEHPGDAT